MRLKKRISNILMTAAGLAALSPMGAIAQDIDFGSYLRAGAGMDAMGGRQDCVNNSGSSGNEFRLGNECSNYGELTLGAHLLKKTGEGSPYFDTFVTIAIASAAQNTQYESTNQTTNPPSAYLYPIQAYAEGGNFDGAHLSYWAGKRFYRDTNTNMNDFFYFANINGIGGGVEDIKTGAGTLKVAVFQETPTISNGSLYAPVVTNNGTSAKQVLDVRLFDVSVAENDALNFWLAGGRNSGGRVVPSTQVTGQPTNYLTGGGVAVGIRHRHTIGKDQNNDFSVQYGTGVMQTLDMSAPLITDSTANKNAYRLRVLDHANLQLSDNWVSEVTATYETRRSASVTNNHSVWYNIGANPVYFITEHFHLATQAGISFVKDQADQATTKVVNNGTRNLWRLAIAPEVNLSKSLYGRPVIRFYAAWSHWNKANQNFVSSSSAEFAQRLAGVSYGFQTEYWF